MDLPAPVSPALIGAIAGVITAAVTSVLAVGTAMRRLRGERAFEKVLDWHERIAATLIETKLKIQTAYAFYGDDSEQSRGKALQLWGETQSLYLKLTQLVRESPLYTTPETIDALVRCITTFDSVSDKTAEFDPPDLARNRSETDKLVPAIDAAYPAVVRGTRRHLGLSEVPSDTLDRLASV